MTRFGGCYGCYVPVERFLLPTSKILAERHKLVAERVALASERLQELRRVAQLSSNFCADRAQARKAVAEAHKVAHMARSIRSPFDVLLERASAAAAVNIRNLPESPDEWSTVGAPRRPS